MKKVILTVFTFLIFIFGLFLYYLKGIDKKISDSQEILKFTVVSGQSSEEISMNLKNQGLIQNPFLFDLYAWQKGLDGKLQAGEYEIPKNLSIKEIIWMLSLQKFRAQKKITVIEGWRNTEIADYLEREGRAKRGDFLEIVSRKSDWWENYEFLDGLPKNTGLEGYLFPDTYLIYENAPVEAIVKKMLENFNQKITKEMRERMDEVGMTLHEALTLASIIEKEVSTKADRELVSGIFHKRLKNGIGLQADSTVNYITGKSKTRSSLDDISLDNPYNTYKYRGLPPGPIANPGLESILAALYPEDNAYFYFLTTNDGKAIYSRTFQEHVAAKNKYLK